MSQPNTKSKSVNKRHRLRRFVLRLFLLALIGVIGWTSYGKLKTEYTVTYDTYTASVGSISNSLTFSGNMQLINSATYTADGSATVRQLYVEEGDEVKKGDKIMRLSDGQTIEAEFNGKINLLSVDKNEEVNPGEELVQIADFDHMSIAIRVDEYDIAQVHVGDACTVTMTASEKKFDSSIQKINYISSSGGNVAYYAAQCEVDVTGEEIYPGMQATVEIVREEADDVVVLKVDALSFDRTNSAFVYQKDENGEMQEVPVTVGVSNGNYCEIKEGLVDGDTVYVESKTKEESKGLFASLFGSTQVNGGPGGMMNNGRSNFDENMSFGGNGDGSGRMSGGFGGNGQSNGSMGGGKP